LHFDTVTTCTEKILTARLVNTGCDTDIVTITNQPGNDYSVLAPTSTVTLYPGDTSIIRIRLLSTQVGNHSGGVTIQVTSKHHPTTTFDLSLDGFVEQRFPAPVIYPLSLDFDSLSYCDTARKQLSITILNRSGCDSLHIDSLWLDGEAALFSTNHNSTATIKPSDSEKVLITFHTGSKGSHSGIVHIRYNDGVSERDTTIVMRAKVTNGTKILSQSTNVFDFGTTTLCDERDSVLVLSNSGCDSVVVEGYKTQGIGFSVDTTFPLLILPNQSIRIPIHTHIDTSNGKTINRDTITFITDADNTLPPIILSRSIKGKSNLAVSITGTPSAHNGEIADFTVSLDKLITGINSLDFTLDYNSDLLTYTNNTSKNTLATSDGHHFTATNITDTTLSTLHMRVTLTKDSTTALTLSNVKLNNGDSTFSNCIASISSASSNFTYLFNCGEHYVQKFLITGGLRIESIKPNPASGNVEVTISREAIPSQLRIKLADALGRVVYDNVQQVNNPNEILHFDASAYTSGLYCLSLQESTTKVTSEIIIMK
jgi:hypothetical protein